MSDVTGAAATTEIRITVRSPGSDTVATTAAVPAGVTHPSGVVPALHRVCDELVAEQVGSTLDDGTEISCRAGCGACCRQLVPILDAEAAYLVDLVGSLPRGQRQVLLTRWRQAVGVIERSGLLERLRTIRGLSPGERRELVVDYFRLGVSCPFLEDESCSIHADRPLACREYLVTSPPEACRGFGDVPVDKVPMPNSLFNRLLATNAEGTGWAPLVLALGPTTTQPLRKKGRPGVELLAEMLGAGLVQSDTRRTRYVTPSLR